MGLSRGVEDRGILIRPLAGFRQIRETFPGLGDQFFRRRFNAVFQFAHEWATIQSERHGRQELDGDDARFLVEAPPPPEQARIQRHRHHRRLYAGVDGGDPRILWLTGSRRRAGAFREEDHLAGLSHPVIGVTQHLLERPGAAVPVDGNSAAFARMPSPNGYPHQFFFHDVVGVVQEQVKDKSVQSRLMLAGNNAGALGQVVAAADLEFAVGHVVDGVTLKPWRRRGAQAAIIRRRVADGRRLGCGLFTSETAPPLPRMPLVSFRNLKRQGFELAYLRYSWILEF